MHDPHIDNFIVAYQAPMLPNVNYGEIEAQGSLFKLTELESGTVEGCIEFLEVLKPALLEERLILTPEVLVAHLCAYLSAVMTVHTVNLAEKLEPLVVGLIQQQAKTAYQHFTQYHINDTVPHIEQKEEHLDKLRQTTPDSILTQTVQLSNTIMSILEELSNSQARYKHANKKEQEVLCSQDTLTKIVLYLSGKRCPRWREKLNGFSDNYVINQLAIQIGWVIGYFAHLANQPLEQTRYFDYGMPTIKLYREHIYKLMEMFAEATYAQEAEDTTKANELLTEIKQLSEKTQSQVRPVITDFQKEFLIAHAGIEKALINLLTSGCSVKIMLMSIFYFWFTLAEPLYCKKPKAIETADPFSYMGNIINLVKKTVKALPNPEFTPEINSLNDKMQALKQYISNQKNLDEVPQAQVTQQTSQVNTAIHTVTSEYLKQNIHPEAVANSLFCHWLRLSVFFGITEQEWQKTDYYVSDILKAVKHYLSTTTHKH